MQNKKILITTYYWPPSGGAGVQRWLKLSKYLSQLGCEIYVVTVKEEEASYPVLDHSLVNEIPSNIKVYKTSTFEPFNLYKKVSRKEKIPFAGFANDDKISFLQKILRFIRGNFFIPDARRGWNKYAFKKCCEIIESKKIDAIITSSPPHSTQLVGLSLKKKYNINWIADLRDPWTDIYYYKKMLHSFVARKLDEYYEKNVLSTADKVIVVSDFIKDQFTLKHTTNSPGNIHVIPNGYDDEDFESVEKKLPEIFTISYTGTITEDYKIEAFISSVIKLIDQNKEVKILIRFVGSMPAKVEEQLNTLGPSFQKLAHVEHSQAIELMCNSHLLLLVIPSVENNKGILTGKLFEYLASARPILCIGPKDGDAAKIVLECEAGNIFDYNEEEQMLKFLTNQVTNYKNGKIFNRDMERVKKYSRRTQAEKVIGMI